MRENKIALVGKSQSELVTIALENGEKGFRGKQIHDWLYKGISSIYQMKNIPKTFLDLLSVKYDIFSMSIEEVLTSATDETKKYLFHLYDGNYIESVFMKYRYGNSLCISSQAGCRMGCSFCASTIDGLKRNLRAEEMLEQILSVKANTGEEINHVVVMGSGEPFDNYEELKKFIFLANDEKTLNIGMRNITVSTCGITPKILKFAKDMPQVNLAVSLHETEDARRSMLMPINKKHGIDELLHACRQYTKMTNRRITFEYALVQDKNDDRASMEALANLLKGMNCHVNLIPLNFVDEIGMSGSGRKQAIWAAELLNKRGIPTTVRRELGSDIKGACGQLRLLNR